MQKLGDGVARNGEAGHAHQAVLGLPGLGRETSELKFQGKAGPAGDGAARDLSVDALREGLENLLGVGSVAGESLGGGAAIGETARVDVALEIGRAKNFGEAALSHALPKLHLEESVLRGD